MSLWAMSWAGLPNAGGPVTPSASEYVRSARGEMRRPSPATYSHAAYGRSRSQSGVVYGVRSRLGVYMSWPSDTSVERQLPTRVESDAHPGRPPPNRFPHQGARSVSSDATTPLVYCSSERRPGRIQKLYASLSRRRRGSQAVDWAAAGAASAASADSAASVVRTAAPTSTPLPPRRSLSKRYSGEGAESGNRLTENQTVDIVGTLIRIHTLEVGHVTHRGVLGDNAVAA